MPVESNNICSNSTLNIVRGEESSPQSIFAWEEGFHSSPGSVVCLYLQKFHTGSFPRKEISVLFHSCLLAVCVWATVHLYWKGAESKAKCNGFELTESDSVRAVVCKDLGSGCNMP